MKKYYFKMVVLLFTLIIFNYSCKKEKDADENGNCVIGGFVSSARFMFWVSKDYGGGTYTVTITNEKGGNVIMDRNIISVYDFSEPNACKTTDVNYLKHGLVGLQYGQKYSYTAASGNKTFTGTITVPCDETYTCKTVQVDHQ